MPTVKRARHLKEVTREAVAPVEAASGRFEALFNQASDAILTLNRSGKIDAANLALEELTGYLKPELEGADIQILIPTSTQLVATPRARGLSPKFFEVPGTYEDIAIVRKDGFVRYVDLTVRHVKDAGEGWALALFRDLTERRRMERELITKHSEMRQAYVALETKTAELQTMQETLVQSGKMAALGELAAGIAHELNQPLQAIRGYAQELQAGGDPESSLKEIIGGVDKMATIIDYLRTFTRKSTENHEPTDVHAAIEESLKMLARQFAARGIEVVRKFDPSLPRVYANPVQLEQVFINLATNARDAIEATGRGRGTVTITTRTQGAFVEVLFSDDGVGMGEKTKTKIFNPFFTTKEVGKGMGLGLSLSFGILNKLHGSMLVQSELSKGATFTVRIPIDFRET